MNTKNKRSHSAKLWALLFEVLALVKAILEIYEAIK